MMNGLFRRASGETLENRSANPQKGFYVFLWPICQQNALIRQENHHSNAPVSWKIPDNCRDQTDKGKGSPNPCSKIPSTTTLKNYIQFGQ
jgi:hypothetical protein